MTDNGLPVYFEWRIWGNTKEPVWGEGLWIRACDELQSNSFTVHLHKQTEGKIRITKTARPSRHSKVDLIFQSLVQLIEEIFLFLLVNEVGMCVDNRVPSLA